MRIALTVLAAAALLAGAGPPVRVIFDTDIGNDIDDALAFAMLHAFESRGEAKLLAVTITKDNRWAPVYADIINHFYGRPEIAIGAVKGGKTPEDSAYIRAPSERKAPDGKWLYPRRLKDGSEAPDAVKVLRDVLSRERDGAVTIVQVGFFTNLARLLESPGGRDLAARKVRLLVLMAGDFANARPEYNVKVDLPASQRVFADWPTPIVTSGFEIGSAIFYPAAAIENHFRYVDHHPIVDGYRLYKKMPYDRETWDLTAVHYAVRPAGTFTLSPKGRIRVDERGVTTFERDTKGRHQYLLADGEGRRKARDEFVILSSRPPDGLIGVPVQPAR
jgi:inosine-uridine nucleoside N-ribohydrolase